MTLVNERLFKITSTVPLKEKSVDLLCRAFPELGTLEWDTINPDCLIRISNVDTFDFMLNPLFFGYRTEKSKTGFFKLRVLPVSCILILNGAQNFKFQIRVEFCTLFTDTNIRLS